MNMRSLFPCGRVDANLRPPPISRAGRRRPGHARAGRPAGRPDRCWPTTRRPTKPAALQPPHFPAKAKSVIWLFMEGAPARVDLFDPKPELDKSDGKKIEIDVFNGNPGPLMKSPFKFQQYGECGAWVCEKYPNVARHVDEIAFIKSCYTESDDHVPALYQINTGIARPGFPTAGAWITYGLGSENRNLPGYVVLGNTQGVKGGPLNWSAGFLPTAIRERCSARRATRSSTSQRPERRDADDDQRAQLDLLAKLNDEHLRAARRARPT